MIRIQEYVFGFQIAMTYVESMAICKTGDYLSKESNRFFFRERAVGRYIVEQLATFDIFKNKIAIIVSNQVRAVVFAFDLQVTSILPDIVQVDNVRMFYQLHDHHLSLNSKRHRPCSLVS